MRLDDELDPVEQAFEDFASARTERLRSINKTLDELDPGANDRLRRYRESHTELGRDSDQTLSLTLPHSFGGFVVALIVEVNPEYTAFSFRARPVEDDDPACDPNSGELTFATAHALKQLMCGDVAPDNQADSAIQALYVVFWDNFFCWLAERARDKHFDNGLSARNALFGDLGRRVGEFHGLILRTQYPPESHSAERGSETRLDEDAKSYAGQLARAKTRNDEDQYPVGRGPLIQMTRWQLLAVRKRVMEFINDRPNFFSRVLAFRNRQSEGVFNEGSSVLCGVFDGMAAYGSTLGGNTPESVRFFVVYGGPSRHQLGRLVMMLHHCGETRLATGFDHNDIIEASARIRALDAKLSGGQAKLKDVTRELQRIAPLGRGGLEYRVTRTRFYLDSMIGKLRELRVRRFEGWQSYEGFVRRNVIERATNAIGVGPRFDALQSRARQLSYTNSTKLLTRQQRNLVELQRTAELIAWGALTYYVGSMLGYALAIVPGAKDAAQYLCRCDESAAKDALKVVGFATAIAFIVSRKAIGAWLVRVKDANPSARFVGIMGFRLASRGRQSNMAR